MCIEGDTDGIMVATLPSRYSVHKIPAVHLKISVFLLLAAGAVRRSHEHIRAIIQFRWAPAYHVRQREMGLWQMA